jgi:hypothetical protein
VRKAKRLYMDRFLNARQPVKRLWQNLECVGVKESTDNNIMFTPDQLNDFFAAASPLTTASPKTTTTADESSIYEEFLCNGTLDLEVFNAIHQIKFNAIGMDDIPIRFLKMILPHIISLWHGKYQKSQQLQRHTLLVVLQTIVL